MLALTILSVLLDIKGSDMSTDTIIRVAIISLLKLLAFIFVLIFFYIYLKKVSKKENYIESYLDKLLSFLKGREPLFAIFFAFILLFSTLIETLGFHFIVGAFIASMFISQSIIGEKNLKTIESTTNSLAMGFLAPIFFAGIGLEFNVSSIQNIGLLIMVLVVSFGSKIIGGYVGGKFAGLSNKVAITLGIGLNARGIMELVIANIAYKAGLITDEIFSILVIMGVFTTLTTPVMLKKFFDKLDKKIPS